MNWITMLNDVFHIAIIPLIIVGSVFLITYISAKNKQIQANIDNETTKKYLDMLEDTITSAVLATTQTYVEALKNQNAFDIEAQQHAFQLSYEAVMKTLTDDAKKYLQAAVGDLEAYITTKIEANVKLSKGEKKNV